MKRGGSLLLDSVMPRYDVRELHDVIVDAPRDAAWAALHRVSLRDVPAFRALMTVRELPGLLVGKRWLTGDVDRPLLDHMVSAGFVLLGQRSLEEIVLGLLTRPWRSVVSREGSDREYFLGFAAPGWAKAALGFKLDGFDRATHVTTETRVLATDASARRWLRAYWLAVGRASGATRRGWLAAIKRRAEGTASS